MTRRGRCDLPEGAGTLPSRGSASVLSLLYAPTHDPGLLYAMINALSMGPLGDGMAQTPAPLQCAAGHSSIN